MITTGMGNYFAELLRHVAGTKKEKLAWLSGVSVALDSLAVWKDGEQYIGVLHHKLPKVLEDLREMRKTLL